MPNIDSERNDTEEEDMDHEPAESEKSSEDDSESGSGEDDGSDLDEEECDQRRTHCLDEMADLERQFSDIKEQLYKERLSQIELKIIEMKAGKAAEYLNPLSELQENMRISTEVAGVLKEYMIAAIQKKFDSEELAAKQNMESEKSLLYDSVKADLEEKIRRLEEDRHNIDISSDLWHESHISKKNKKKNDSFSTDRRKKPITVTGPYIVYLLQDVEIIEDWTEIKKALKQCQKKKIECEF